MSQRHNVTWFKRDERGQWQWQGFRPELDTDDKIVAWFEQMQLEYAEGPEVFVVDLENFDGPVHEGDGLPPELELELLRGWLDEVVDIDKITVEEEFPEYCKRKLAESEKDDPGVDTSEEHVREGK